MRKAFIYLFLINTCFCFSQEKRRVLFIGNSYTYVNNLPQLVKDIALSKSDTLIFDQSVFGGFTFQDHYSTAQTYTKIKSQPWDVVVIQGQSQEASLAPLVVMNNSYTYAKRLADSVRANNPCTEVMFYMTWGRKNADPDFCPTYTPSCSYAGMQSRLRESYLMFADSFNASCAPVGVAWKTFRNAYPSIELYQGDESHPSPEGSYLAACVFYSSVFKKTVTGATYYSTVTQTDAQNMQTIAGNTVMDSLSVWNLNSQIPTANFNYSLVTGTTYQFNNTSVNANSYNWSFGSGQNSPQYTFAGNPPYSVTLTAVNGCTNNVLIKTIGVTGMETNTWNKNKMYFSSENNSLMLLPADHTENTSITIYDVGGRLVASYKAIEQNKNISLDFLQKGIYTVYLTQPTQKTIIKIVKE